MLPTIFTKNTQTFYVYKMSINGHFDHFGSSSVNLRELSKFNQSPAWFTNFPTLGCSLSKRLPPLVSVDWSRDDILSPKDGTLHNRRSIVAEEISSQAGKGKRMKKKEELQRSGVVFPVRLPARPLIHFWLSVSRVFAALFSHTRARVSSPYIFGETSVKQERLSPGFWVDFALWT